MSIRAKRISIEAFEKGVAEAVGEPTANVDWHGNAVFVRKKLPLVSMMEFVRDVVESCFAEKTDAYMPEFRDFAIRRAVLTKYANFSLPKDAEKCYELVVGCDVYPAILGIIDEAQFREMLKAVDDKIANRVAMQTEAVIAQCNDMYAALSDLENRLSKLLGAIDVDSLTNLIAAMTKNGLDEGKLVQAYLDARNSKESDEAEQEPVVEK